MCLLIPHFLIFIWPHPYPSCWSSSWYHSHIHDTDNQLDHINLMDIPISNILTTSSIILSPNTLIISLIILIISYQVRVVSSGKQRRIFCVGQEVVFLHEFFVVHVLLSDLFLILSVLMLLSYIIRTRYLCLLIFDRFISCPSLLFMSMFYMLLGSWM